ncbi:MAG: arginine deiminase-related protein [Pirellulaceae bacterium]|nr:arginine deiminase-related protein [Pirellulaceae bacterium]
MSLIKEQQSKQTASTVLAMRPKVFHYTDEAAESNSFMRSTTLSHQEQLKTALNEFDHFVETLQKKDIDLLVYQAKNESAATIFPNNWFTTHTDGRLVLYPMAVTHRRLEREKKLYERFLLQNNFSVSEILDWTHYENEGLFLEGTGSLVLDRQNRVAYASLSPRANHKLLEKFSQCFGYHLVSFEAFDQTKKSIYHTNVMMSVGQKMAVVTLPAISNLKEKNELLASFEKSGLEVINLSFEQMDQFCGNVLEVQSKSGEPVLVMSERAYRHFSKAQMAVLEKHVTPLFSPIPSIETFSGGGTRCMLAEIFLPRVENQET